ncbi:uncharacterized protein CMU_033590 [Cryptosporidium muris RN66]|uniref:Uncharacterized protein n=1 Tax=Cryptosporidium muris (strain RN66) TaxID=441375 RepID=B6AFI3_CRYMR|nr:uncharacterized protein CMU_033590 [Cryptosporidium muris RN66]EEA06974.1 hypothetical protein, conserved [Cryptosporidium muris RN66]|eukprot:XP_002141323.1 hypothetical protein [Cryptosporidium muris RN66]
MQLDEDFSYIGAEDKSHFYIKTQGSNNMTNCTISTINTSQFIYTNNEPPYSDFGNIKMRSYVATGSKGDPTGKNYVCTNEIVDSSLFNYCNTTSNHQYIHTKYSNTILSENVPTEISSFNIRVPQEEALVPPFDYREIDSKHPFYISEKVIGTSSSNECELLSICTKDNDIPKIYTHVDPFGMKCRYITDFYIYNSKKSRMIPLDIIPDYYVQKELEFGGLKLKGDVEMLKSKDRTKYEVETCLDEAQLNSKFLLIGSLIPSELVHNIDSEKEKILRENYRKLTRYRQSGGKYVPKKVENGNCINKKLLKNSNLFQISTAICSWSIDYGQKPYDIPYIWLYSKAPTSKGSNRIVFDACYRLDRPATRYNKTFSSGKIKFDILTRFIKTVIFQNFHKGGIKTFVDQITGKSPCYVSSTIKHIDLTDSTLNEQIPDTPQSGKASHRRLVKNIQKFKDSTLLSSTPWGAPIIIDGCSEYLLLELLPCIELHLRQYSLAYNIPKLLDSQLYISLKNRIIKLISNCEPSLSEEYISSNISSLLDNTHIKEKLVLSTGKMHSSISAKPKPKKYAYSKSKMLALNQLLYDGILFGDSITQSLHILVVADFFRAFGRKINIPFISSYISIIELLAYSGGELPHPRNVINMLQKFFSEVLTSLNTMIKEQFTEIKFNEKFDPVLKISRKLEGIDKICQLIPVSLFSLNIGKLCELLIEHCDSISSKSNGIYPFSIFQINEETRNILNYCNSKCIPYEYWLINSFSNSLLDNQIHQQTCGFVDYTVDKCQCGCNKGVDTNYPLTLLSYIGCNEIWTDNITWPVMLRRIVYEMSHSFSESIVNSINKNFIGMNSNKCVWKLDQSKAKHFGTSIFEANEIFRYLDIQSDMPSGSRKLELMHWLVEVVGTGPVGKRLVESKDELISEDSNCSKYLKSSTLPDQTDVLLGEDRCGNRYYAFEDFYPELVSSPLNSVIQQNSKSDIWIMVEIIDKSILSINSYNKTIPKDSKSYITNTIENHLYNPSNDILRTEHNSLNDISTIYSGNSNINCTTREKVKSFYILQGKEKIRLLLSLLDNEIPSEKQLKVKFSHMVDNEANFCKTTVSEYIQQSLKRKEEICTLSSSSKSLSADIYFEFILAAMSLLREIFIVYLKCNIPLSFKCFFEYSESSNVLDIITKIFCYLNDNIFVTNSNSILKTILEDILNLVKIICKEILGIIEHLNTIYIKEVNLFLYKWDVEVNCIQSLLNEVEVEINFREYLSILAIYFRMWIFIAIPTDIFILCFGSYEKITKTQKLGFTLNREQFISSLGLLELSKMKSENIIAKNMYYPEEKYNYTILDFIPKVNQYLVYFRTGNLLVYLDWESSKQISESGIHVVPFLEILSQKSSFQMSDIKKVKVINILYNCGSTHTQEFVRQPSGNVNPVFQLNSKFCPHFLYLLCEVIPTDETCKDDSIHYYIKLLQNTQIFNKNLTNNVDPYKPTRTSDRIKENAMSSSFRDAALIDTTLSLTESRNHFINKELYLLAKTELLHQNNSKYAHLVIPTTLYSNTIRKLSNIIPAVNYSSNINITPSSPFYAVKEEVVIQSIKHLLNKNGGKIKYYNHRFPAKTRLKSGTIRRLLLENLDLWECLLLESDDSKKPRESSLHCINLWDII